MSLAIVSDLRLVRCLILVHYKQSHGRVTSSTGYSGGSPWKISLIWRGRSSRCASL